MLYIISTYTAMILYFSMGIYVFHLDHRAKINRLLILVCILFVISTLSELLAYNFNDRNYAFAFSQISQLGMLNYSGLMLVMTIILTHKEHLLDKEWKKLVIYFPGIFCSLYQIVWLGGFAQTDFLSSSLEYFENFYIYLNVILALGLVWHWKKTTKLNREREIAKIILTFGLITFILITVNDFIINKYISIDQILLLVFMFSIWYANKEYRFLDIASLISANDIVDKITDLVFLADDNGIILRANDRAKAVLEDKEDKLSGKKLAETVNADFSAVINALKQNPKKVYELDDDIYCQTKQGTSIPINIYASAVRDNVGEIVGIVVVYQDKTVLKQLQNEIKERTSKEQQLYYLSIHDSLTGLYNRTHFEQIMNRYQQEQQDSLGIIICDVDGLKFTNDTLGHELGDKLLIRTARILKKHLKNNEMPFRIGGDEFTVLIPGNSKEAIGELCNSLRETIDKYNIENPEKIIHISIGYAFSTAKEKKVKELFKEADDNMYIQKLSHVASVRSHTIKALMKTLEVRDFVKEGHIERVSALLANLSKNMMLSDNVAANLQLLARFHDIGKVGIPDNVLFKTGPLNEQEYKEMQRHSEIGYRIAQALPELSTIAEKILKHHERWDGKGYPLGIKGEDIPLECRILAIAEAYEAMTSDRPYRKAMTHEEALKELNNNSNLQFDPYIVEKFLEILN